MATQGLIARGKMEWLNKWKFRANHSAMGWTENIKCGVKTPAIVHERVRDDFEKQWEEQQQNKEHRQMKIQQQKKKIENENEEHQHLKNLTGGSPKQSNIAVSFCWRPDSDI